MFLLTLRRFVFYYAVVRMANGSFRTTFFPASHYTQQQINNQSFSLYVKTVRMGPLYGGTHSQSVCLKYIIIHQLCFKSATMMHMQM